ncbi:MAG: Wzz/FepE/Etk N-terminal domain-containing protein [Steroidobacteraceae bacterium]
MNTNTQDWDEDDELDLRELFRTLWKGKWFILAVTAMAAAISVAVALWLPNEYKATVVLTPASTSSTSSLSRLAGQFGGLAALAGVNLGGQSDGDKTVVAMELVKSWGFQEQFIRDNQLEVPVFAAKGWNRATNQLVIDPDVFDAKKKAWVRKFKSADGQTAQPGGWELYEELSKRISITQDKKTNLITLSVEYYSPYLAKEWADKIIVAVNKHLQDQDRREASKSIGYLQKKMNETSLTEMRSVFSRLIEEQTKNLMLADVSDEYVLKTLSPAKVPEQKSGPKRALICVLGILVGVFVSVFAWFGISMMNSRKRVFDKS